MGIRDDSIVFLNRVFAPNPSLEICRPVKGRKEGREEGREGRMEGKEGWKGRQGRKGGERLVGRYSGRFHCFRG